MMTALQARDFELPCGKRLGDATKAEITTAAKELWSQVEDKAADPRGKLGTYSPAREACERYGRFHEALAVWTTWKQDL